jgi:hypothetical protein
MKFVDDLFKLYRNHLTGDDEDAIEIVLSLFADHKREDLEVFISDLSDEELFQMVSIYVIEMIKRKMTEEGLDTFKAKEIPQDPNIH